MAIINFNSISGVSTISVASSITVGNNVSIGTDRVTATNFIGNVTGQISGIQTSITVGDKFISSSGVGLGATTTTGRNAGVGTATGTIVYNSTNSSFEGYFGPTGWQTIKTNFVASGGTEIISGLTKHHVFIGNGSFVVSSGIKNDVQALVIGGGGGGGDGYGSAGGGAGSAVNAVNISLTPGTYPVTVGSGGTGANSPGTTPGPVCIGGDGAPSSLAFPAPIIALGGGGGGSGSSSDPILIVSGRPGGSGGGGGYYSTPGSPNGPNAGGTGTAPPTSPASNPTSGTGGKSYQNDGGAGWYSGAGSIQLGGGGGGAGGVGGNFNPPRSYGGPGQSFGLYPAPLLEPAIPAPVRPSWSPAVGPTGLFAGGGGGAWQPVGPYPGGPGGGGPGSTAGNNGTAGVDYTGSGGGGAGGPAMGGAAGNGGIGIVIISYPTI
jgi:hypothetical protein